MSKFKENKEAIVKESLEAFDKVIENTPFLKMSDHLTEKDNEFNSFKLSDYLIPNPPFGKITINALNFIALVIVSGLVLFAIIFFGSTVYFKDFYNSMVNNIPLMLFIVIVCATVCFIPSFLVIDKIPDNEIKKLVTFKNSPEVVDFLRSLISIHGLGIFNIGDNELFLASDIITNTKHKVKYYGLNVFNINQKDSKGVIIKYIYNPDTITLVANYKNFKKIFPKLGKLKNNNYYSVVS